MIPNLKKSGLLPTGIYPATWNEFEKRFAINQHRIVLLIGFKKGLKLLYKYGCTSVYVGGSFVTTEPQPGDVDVCFDNSFMRWKEFSKSHPEFAMNKQGFYNQFKNYKSNFYPCNAYDDYFLHYFQFSRNGEAKGLVKLSLTEIFSNDSK